MAKVLIFTGATSDKISV